MQDFEYIKNELETRNIPYELVEFSDTAISARDNDTSLSGNYNPENAVKTLIIKTKLGYKGVLLKGSKQMDGVKLKALVGRWRVVSFEELTSELGLVAGGICPLTLHFEVLIDNSIHELTVLSIGAGDLSKGINIEREVALKNIENKSFVDISN